MTYREWWEWGASVLEKAMVDEAKLDARLLLEYACHIDHSGLFMRAGEEPEPERLAVYQTLIRRRAERIPLQQLTGVQNFMGLDFKVNEHVLVPRQDTETLVEEALRSLRGEMRILDMCTGSGCILLSLLHYVDGCLGVGVDLSEEALAVAKENSASLLGEQGKRAAFLHSDLFEKVEGRFDMIVSNPPYIVRDKIPTLMPEVRDHEPVMALDGGEDGLCFYRRIVEESRDYLKRDGWLYLEIGCDQAESVSEFLKRSGFVEIRVVKDLGCLDRVVCGRCAVGKSEDGYV
ncbi:MAG: peptide chain release factor N(5)-glutamine methyltransferase [Candidatus Gastranaerophilales bacterium]|nr:peptide chain release factor N(5)-glutamine methyltransferase [Candidatus Gastranaerophilales bacterium]